MLKKIDHARTKDSSRRARDNMLTIVELSNILSKIRSTDASVALHVHEVTES